MSLSETGGLLAGFEQRVHTLERLVEELTKSNVRYVAENKDLRQMIAVVAKENAELNLMLTKINHHSKASENG